MGLTDCRDESSLSGVPLETTLNSFWASLVDAGSDMLIDTHEISCERENREAVWKGAVMCP
jgi:hypothetical protein